MLRASRFFWYVSILAFLVGFMYSYAYLPKELVVFVQNNANVTISKEVFFYIGLAVFLTTNAILYVTGNTMGKRLTRSDRVGPLFAQRMHTWFVGLTVIFNIFFIFSSGIIALINDPEEYRLGIFGALIYIPIGLLFIWFFVLFYYIINWNK